MQQILKLVAKFLQFLNPLRRGLHNFCLRLKDSAPFPFGKHAHHFAQAPTRSAQDLQAIHPRDEQGDAVVAHYANALGIAFKSLELKSRKIKALELFGGIRSEEHTSELQSLRHL